MKKRVTEIDRAARNNTEKGRGKPKEGYKKLLETVRRAVGQAKQFTAEIVRGVQQATTEATQKVPPPSRSSTP